MFYYGRQQQIFLCLATKHCLKTVYTVQLSNIPMFCLWYLLKKKHPTKPIKETKFKNRNFPSFKKIKVTGWVWWKYKKKKNKTRGSHITDCLLCEQSLITQCFVFLNRTISYSYWLRKTDINQRKKTEGGGYFRLKNKGLVPTVLFFCFQKVCFTVEPC